MADGAFGFAAAPVSAGQEDVSGQGRRLAAFISGARPGGYIALQAFLDPAPATRRALESLAAAIGARTGLPVTTGFGPRFLHSTGQLHKGGPGRGLYIQITGGWKRDSAIPETGGKRPAPSFGTLLGAQAAGDRMALREAGRKVIRIDLGNRIVQGLGRIARSL